IGQFIDMANYFAQYKWFRIILVLRTASLLRFESLFKDTVINPQWFSMQNGGSIKDSAGMPVFSHTELYQLTQNINGSFSPYPLIKSQSTQLTHTPLFFQYYYDIAGDKLNPQQITSFDEYLVVVQYLKKKIFNGVNTMGKQTLMQELSPMIEKRDGRLQIGMKDANTVVKQHRAAYNDLLYSGLVHET